MSLQTMRYISNLNNGMSIRTHNSHIQQVILLSYSPILFSTSGFIRKNTGYTNYYHN